MGIEIKACKKCGKICESTIPRCPALLSGTLDICDSSDFKPLTIEELFEKADGNSIPIRIYFEKWPEWPNPESWHQLTNKYGLESLANKNLPVLG